MDLKNWFKSNWFKGATIGILALILLLLTFKAGMMVGFGKADFSHRWSDNYHRNFGGPRNGFLKDFRDRDFIDAHGTFGQIIKIDDTSLVIKGRDDIEKIITVKDSTVIKSLKETIKLTDLKINDYIVTIGYPDNSGQIEAKLIRLMPPPPSGDKKTSPAPKMMLPPDDGPDPF